MLIFVWVAALFRPWITLAMSTLLTEFPFVGPPTPGPPHGGEAVPLASESVRVAMRLAEEVLGPESPAQPPARAALEKIASLKHEVEIYF